MSKYKKPLVFALCLLPIAIIAGIFVGFYQLDTYSEEIIAEVVAEIGSTDILIVVAAVQTVDYIISFFGFHSSINGQANSPELTQAKENIEIWISEKHELYITLIRKTHFHQTLAKPPQIW